MRRAEGSAAVPGRDKRRPRKSRGNVTREHCACVSLSAAVQSLWASWFFFPQPDDLQVGRADRRPPTVCVSSSRRGTRGRHRRRRRRRRCFLYTRDILDSQVVFPPFRTLYIMIIRRETGCSSRDLYLLHLRIIIDGTRRAPSTVFVLVVFVCSRRVFRVSYTLCIVYRTHEKDTMCPIQV